MLNLAAQDGPRMKLQGMDYRHKALAASEKPAPGLVKARWRTDGSRSPPHQPHSAPFDFYRRLIIVAAGLLGSIIDAVNTAAIIEQVNLLGGHVLAKGGNQ